VRLLIPIDPLTEPPVLPERAIGAGDFPHQRPALWMPLLQVLLDNLHQLVVLQHFSFSVQPSGSNLWTGSWNPPVPDQTPSSASSAARSLLPRLSLKLWSQASGSLQARQVAPASFSHQLPQLPSMVDRLLELGHHFLRHTERKPPPSLPARQGPPDMPFPRRTGWAVFSNALLPPK